MLCTLAGFQSPFLFLLCGFNINEQNLVGGKERKGKKERKGEKRRACAQLYSMLCIYQHVCHIAFFSSRFHFVLNKGKCCLLQ